MPTVDIMARITTLIVFAVTLSLCTHGCLGNTALEKLLLGDPASTDVEGLGNGLWRTFGFEYAIPYNTSMAESMEWVNTGKTCDDNQGIVYSQTSSGVSKWHPLQILYTSAGQLAGLRVTIYGSSDTSKIGNAAQPQLIKNGYWIPTPGQDKTWYLTLSTRSKDYMCSGKASTDLLGDQLVINQGTIDFSIPLTARDAQSQGYVPGSCMKTMGQHWMLDLSLRNGQLSWVEGNLLPVVPMYYPPSIDGTIHAVFFTTPVAQFGSTLFGHGDWETPALTATLMCENFCSSDCHWTTHFWSTMHIYFDSNFKTATCPGGSGIVDRSCPKD